MTPGERRWTDERLDDRFAAIDEALKLHKTTLDMMSDTSVRVASLNAKVDAVAEDTLECKRGIAQVVDGLARTAETLQAQQLAQANAKLAERAELQRERVSDRRWLIGTVLTVCALIVATIGVLHATGLL